MKKEKESKKYYEANECRQNLCERSTVLENRVDCGMTNIKKTQQIINSIVFSGLLFVMMMQSFLFDGWTHWAEDAHFFVDSNGLLQIAFFLSCLATLLEMPISGPRALLAAVMIIIPRVFTITHQNFLLTEMVLLASLSNLNSRKQNMYIWMFAHILYGGLLGWLNFQGLVTPVMDKWKVLLELPIKSSSLGMGHPNSLALFIMSTVMILWVILKQHLRGWRTFFLYFISALGTVYLTLCRTVGIIMIVFPFLKLLIEMLWKKEWKSRDLFFFLIPFFIMAITLGISVLITNNPSINLNRTFSVRFREFQNIIDYYHMPFGLSGAIDGVYIYFDNLYMMLIACCGYIPTIIILLSCGRMMMYLSKRKDIELLLVTIVFLLYGIMENAMIYFIYFFVPILAFADRRNIIPSSSDVSDDVKANIMEEPERG